MNTRGIVVGGHPTTKRDLARAARRTMTPSEKLLWQALRTNRLGGYHFRRQQIIDGFIVDFYCHAAGLVVEVDGGIHEDQKKNDAERDRIIAARGLLVYRVTNEALFADPAKVLETVFAICRERIRSDHVGSRSETASPFPSGARNERSGQGRGSGG